MPGGLPDDEEVILASTWWQKAENAAVVLLLALMVAMPVYAVIVRWTTGAALAGVNLWVQALNLWMAFIGGALAARTSQHLALSTGQLFDMSDRLRDWVQGFTMAVATAVTAYLAYASVLLVYSETGSTQTLVGGVPMWAIQVVMPLGFLAMAVRFAWKENDTWQGRFAALVAVAAAALLALVPPEHRHIVVWSGAGVLSLAVAMGAPLFTVMGGLGMLLFYGAPIPISISAVPAETFRIVSDPTLVSLPLFTLAGYVLAEGGASRRLIDFFNAWFGWLPGGVAAAAVLVCAFFTTFTGASGVTILALGGLLLPALEAAGYTKKFAIGLLAASGSIGLLFPPSLPVILYGVASNVPITDLFIGGAVPGVILVGMVVGLSVVVRVREGGFRQWLPAPEADLADLVRGRSRAMAAAAWNAKTELALPVLVLVGLFGGFMTIFEAAAFTALYALLNEVVFHRDLHWWRDLPQVFVETASLMGGVLIILGVALGFTSYLVDAEIPLQVRDWVQAHVENKYVFILMLNMLLLGVGCLMDIYSAIVVVVPLIEPVAEVYGIHPTHLGILFLANLELGYLTPPVGLNLFFASFRFKVPLTKMYRYALPFLATMGVGVLIIAYVPYATTWYFDDEPSGQQTDFFDDDSLLEEGAGTGQPGMPSADDMQRMLEEDTDAGTGAAGGMPSAQDMMQELEDMDTDEPTDVPAPDAMPSAQDMMQELEDMDTDEPTDVPAPDEMPSPEQLMQELDEVDTDTQ